MPKIKEKWFSKYLEDEIPSLKDKVIVITGTTSGLGYWVTVGAIRKNASRIYLVNRPSERVSASMKKLEEEIEKSQSDTILVNVDCDLSSFDSVRKGGNEILELLAEDNVEGIDILINNAGFGKKIDLTKDGYLSCAQVNHLSHFLLTSLLFDAISAAAKVKGEARIVNHSSAARYFFSLTEKHYQPLAESELRSIKQPKLYSCTKIANCLFSIELHRRLKEGNIKSIIAEPGLARAEKSGIFAFLHPTQSYADGAMPMIKAAFGDSVNSGDFFCPGGFINLRGKPVHALKECKPTGYLYKEKNILNADLARKLWKLSEKATGVTFLPLE